MGACWPAGRLFLATPVDTKCYGSILFPLAVAVGRRDSARCSSATSAMQTQVLTDTPSGTCATDARWCGERWVPSDVVWYALRSSRSIAALIACFSASNGACNVWQHVEGRVVIRRVFSSLIWVHGMISDLQAAATMPPSRGPVQWPRLRHDDSCSDVNENERRTSRVGRVVVVHTYARASSS